MTEKIGLIKNPLTIIAIFAGIAEVSGTIVLPFIAPVNQELFIYFLILFPSILVILFFITLNFNNKVLYAPSDYKDEANYIKINKYDLSKQKTIEISVPKNDIKSVELTNLSEKVEYLNSQMQRFEATVTSETKSNQSYIETIGVEFLVSAFKNVKQFVNYMRQFEVDFEIYRSPRTDDNYYSYPSLRAIWLGKDVELKLSQLVIEKSKEFFPHLKYIKLSDEDEFHSHKQIYIGGSTESAVNLFKCKPLSDSDFDTLKTFTDIESFHNFIEKFTD